MSIEYKRLFKHLCEAKCAKRPVTAGTYDQNGVWVQEHNVCNVLYNAIDFGEEPRKMYCARDSEADPDSDYALSICASQHAEARLANVMHQRGLVSDGVAWVAGHYYACRACAAALRAVGVKEIRVKELA